MVLQQPTLEDTSRDAIVDDIQAKVLERSKKESRQVSHRSFALQLSSEARTDV